nr:helix-turn-helix domain-containing protein [Streptomyces roseochromogenus]
MARFRPEPGRRLRRPHPPRTAHGPRRAAGLGRRGAAAAGRTAAPCRRRTARHHPARPRVDRRERGQGARRQLQHGPRPDGPGRRAARRRLLPAGRPSRRPRGPQRRGRTRLVRPPRCTLDPPARCQLAELLRTSARHAWAAGIVGRLGDDGRDLRRTLRAWTGADAHAEHSAQALGVHARTVREHLRAAEPVLERRLTAGGTDLYEVVLAQLVTGELHVPGLGRAAVPAPGAANPDQPDAPVHR